MKEQDASLHIGQHTQGGGQEADSVSLLIGRLAGAPREGSSRVLDDDPHAHDGTPPQLIRNPCAGCRSRASV